MKDILTSEEIVGLLSDDIPFERATELAYTQVFPFEYIPDTVEHGNTFICFDVDIQKSTSKTFLLPTLFVWVFTHSSKLRLPDGRGVRTDLLCHEIAKILNGSHFYGLGELELFSVKRFAPMTDFQGKSMMYNAVDFNRPHNPKRIIPSNRKA